MTPIETSRSEKSNRPSLWTDMRSHEDWWAIWCGLFLLALALAAVWSSRPADMADRLAAGETVKLSNPLKDWLASPGAWVASPLDALYRPAAVDKKAEHRWFGVLGSGALIGLLFAAAIGFRRKAMGDFLMAFPILFLMATVAYVMSTQELVNAFNLEYVLWALLLGLVISNLLGTPAWLKPAMLTEFYIKTGLVLLGAEVLFNKLLALGLPGVFVAWVVTPIVLISTYVFGQRVLKLESRSLNMVISADMSVCGVSAAIATAAACKAKKEELSLAIGISLTFTVFMMVAMPAVIKAVGMDEVVAGAWIGGTIDSTGAVAAAGAALGEQAMNVAATVKMIQNILIGAVAFGVAVYWVTWVERDPNAIRPNAMEIWYRFPKFVLGFMGASILCSLLQENFAGGTQWVDATIGSTKVLRGWFFCLAFVSIGLETNFRSLMPYLSSGKPLLLYVCGQALNLLLTLLMAWLMFKVVFPS